MWGLVVIGIISIAFAVGIIFLILRLTNEPNTHVNTEKVDAKSQLPWKLYTVDIIENILWQWKYDYYRGDIDERSLIALCPKCKRELDVVKNHYYAAPAFNLKCPNCDFRTSDTGGGTVDFKRGVIKEIEGRIRSGEFQDKIK